MFIRKHNQFLQKIGHNNYATNDTYTLLLFLRAKGFTNLPTSGNKWMYARLTHASGGTVVIFRTGAIALAGSNTSAVAALLDEYGAVQR